MVAINHLVHERQKEGVRAASEQSSMDFLLPINASTKYYLVLQPDPTCIQQHKATHPYNMPAYLSEYDVLAIQP